MTQPPPMPLALDPANDDDPCSNPCTNRVFADVLAERLSRRAFLGAVGMGAAAAAMATSPLAWANGPSSLTFTELAHGYDENLHVAEGYEQQVLIRWGDKVTADAPAFDVMDQSPAAQAKQFGYNNDFLGYFPLPAGSRNSENGLLVVNHEYTIPGLMFAGTTSEAYSEKATPDQVDIELAAHGLSVLEVKKESGRWRVVEESRYARRITAGATAMRLSGPAAGHDRLKTKADPTGMRVIGTLNNCAGGITPWGTVLTAEENFNGYFGGDPATTPEAANYKRYGLSSKARYPWNKVHARFNVEAEPNEPNRFGWIVEFDPYDSGSVPVKRTALGRFKHEGATVVVNRDGRVVLYSGDDERFDYVYRFVTHGRFNPDDRAANRDLLDSGTLFVARFEADGALHWMPLVWGTGPLTPANGFASQADVLIETRRAADLLGATPMDRPEDVEPNPATGIVYLLLTNNTRRTTEQVDAVNPRAENRHGHIVEMIPPGAGPNSGAGADHTALTYKWEIMIQAGDPAKSDDGAKYNDGVSANGWLSCPDNCAFDSKGRLWIATDGAPSAAKIADGVWATDVSGDGRALTRHFLRTPRGAELCGPTFTPDDRTLFVAVQHPGEEKGSSFDSPTTRWPDFDAKIPPRPSVVVVTKRDGGVIGT